MEVLILKIYCCKCESEVKAKMTDGAEIYPHRKDLYKLLFWKCDRCGNYVGCHKNTDKPLGVIPSEELRKIRIKIHSIIDPIWKKGIKTRKEVYNILKNKIGYEYHTANIKNLEEAEKILKIVFSEFIN